jgi:hypothetical protein
MDWITLSHHEVNHDALASVCVHCGARGTHRHNRTFEWHPKFVEYLTLLGIVPGIIAAAFCKKEMRVSLPVCERHQAMTVPQGFFVFGGWFFLPALFVGVVLGAMALVDKFDILQPIALWQWITFPIVAGVIGLIPWLIGVLRIRRGYRSLSVHSIDDNGIALIGLCDPFVKAMLDQRQSATSLYTPASHTNSNILRHSDV